MKMLPGGVTAPKGFQASGVHCGVKKGKGDGNQPPMSKMPEVLEGKKDLASSSRRGSAPPPPCTPSTG